MVKFRRYYRHPAHYGKLFTRGISSSRVSEFHRERDRQTLKRMCQTRPSTPDIFDDIFQSKNFTLMPPIKRFRSRRTRPSCNLCYRSRKMYLVSRSKVDPLMEFKFANDVLGRYPVYKTVHNISNYRGSFTIHPMQVQSDQFHYLLRFEEDAAERVWRCEEGRCRTKPSTERGGRHRSLPVWPPTRRHRGRN